MAQRHHADARELLDESVRPGAPEAAITDQHSYVMHCLRTDPGIADHGKCVEGTIKGIAPGVTESSHAWINLREHIDRMYDSYLVNWADCLDSLDSPTPSGAPMLRPGMVGLAGMVGPARGSRGSPRPGRL
jgi:hypothetical protein